MLVIAHRGASGHRPENTASAYELAIQMGADMIEVDLHRTRDGEVVIVHDSRLPGLGEIALATREQVLALDAGGGEHVPTLDEVLDRFATRIPFNLEIKWGQAGDYEGLEGQVLAALRDRDLSDDILFSCFRPSVLRRLREQDPGARLALLVSPEDRSYSLESALACAGELGCEALNPHWVLTDETLVARAHEAGLGVNVYTVNEMRGMRRMLELRVDGVFTNFPDQLRAVLDAST